MPQDWPHPQSSAPPLPAQALAPVSRTERYVLHAWILIIAGALLWVLLS